MNRVLPQVTGRAKVGEVLECSTGEWSGTPEISFSQVWLLDGVAIAGEVQSTYKVRQEDEGHVLSCQVLASNAAGVSKPARSVGVSVPVLPVNRVAPMITGGLKAGETMSCTSGTWTGTPTLNYVYEWRRSTATISGANHDTYEVHGEDEGHALLCQVTAINSAGSVSAVSNTVVVPEEAKKRQEEEAAV
ncbi:MAG TPA: hypothetical protein VK774_00820, partial [Solirubrobacteraceae bacterium]|nr:hypothetical protein [Solirubrobacteraceae bacterium]